MQVDGGNLSNDTILMVSENAILILNLGYSLSKGGAYVLEKPTAKRLSALAPGI